MNLLHTRFIKELSGVVLATLLFMANFAFIFIPTALGGIPGRTAERGIPSSWAMADPVAELPASRRS